MFFFVPSFPDNPRIAHGTWFSEDRWPTDCISGRYISSALLQTWVFVSESVLDLPALAVE